MSFFDTLFNRPQKLTQTQHEFWDTNGYLILKRCIKPALIDRYQHELDQLWENRARNDNSLVIDFWEGPQSMTIRSREEASSRIIGMPRTSNPNA